ncbi:MAG: glycosyl hydrolase family 28-related protein [Verrucomicrobiota bacterium]
MDDSLFVNVDPGSADRLEANFAEDTDTAQHFLVEDAGGGNIRLISRSTGDYVIAGATGQNRLFATGTQSDPLAVFQWTDVGTNIVRLTNIDLGNDVHFTGNQKTVRASSTGTGTNFQWIWEIKSVNVPRIADTSFSDFDTPLYTIDAVAEFGADNTGATDTTAQIQAALDAAANAFGGIVYLPEGEYLIQNTLAIPKSCTLRGDWNRPSDSDLKVRGTVLRINHGAGTSSPSAITIADDASIRDLSIYYPGQTLPSPNNPVEYPYTLEGIGTFSTVRNITLVNSYRGIRFEPQGDEKVKLGSIIGVFGSPLFRGTSITDNAATVRVQDVHFAPKFWASAGLDGVTQGNIRNALEGNNSIAFSTGNGAGGGLYIGLSCEDYDIGLQAFNGGSATRFFDLKFDDCAIGIDLPVSEARPYLFAGGYIKAEDIAVRLNGSFKAAVFNSFFFQSDNILIEHDSGEVNFTNCNFSDWGSGYAIDSARGRVVIAGCEFGKSSQHINLQADVKRTAIFGNTPTGSALDVLNNSTAAVEQIIIDTTSKHIFAELDATTYPFITHDRLPSPPSGVANVFNVMDYGATGDAFTDDTQAVQDALDAAGAVANASAGAIVFVPPGVYRLDGRITVPSFIELRGIHDSPFNFDSRSIFALYADQGQINNPATLTLAADSGISGLAFYRPDQTWDSTESDTTPIEYPFAVRGTDRNWAYNILLINTYDGIDFNFGGGHRLDFIYTCPINDSVELRADGDVTVLDNFQGKVDAWRAARNYTLPAFVATDWAEGIPNANEDSGLTLIGNGPAVHGYGQFRMMGHFVNGAGINLYEINDSPTFNLYLGGGEFSRLGSPDVVGVRVNSADDTTPMDVEIVGCSWNLSGQGIITASTGAGDRLIAIGNKAAAKATVTYNLTGDGRTVVQQDWRGGSSFSSHLSIDGGGIGIIEAQDIRKRTTLATAQAKGTSQIKICGSLYDKNPAIDDWLFETIDENQIFFVGNAPDIITGITGNGGALGVTDTVAPNTPSGLSATAADDAVILNWADNTESDLSLYGVYRSETSGGPYVNIQDVVASEFTDYTANNGTTYYYVVTAIDISANESSTSTEVTAQPGALTTILVDRFETGFGNWIDGGNDCILNTSGTFVNGTNGVVNIRDDSSSSNISTGDLALSGFSEVLVEFDYEVVGFEGSESFVLEVSTDGGSSYSAVQTWINDIDFADDGSVYNNESVLVSGFILTDQTRIRFRCDASANNDNVYLDDIRILAR